MPPWARSENPNGCRNRRPSCLTAGRWPLRAWADESIRLNDVVETGDLLRIMAAIDEVRAAAFAQELDMRRIVVQCRQDRNLGHHAVLIQGRVLGKA